MLEKKKVPPLRLGVGGRNERPRRCPFKVSTPCSIIWPGLRESVCFPWGPAHLLKHGVFSPALKQLPLQLHLEQSPVTC